MRWPLSVPKLCLTLLFSVWVIACGGDNKFPDGSNLKISPTTAAVEVGQNTTLTATASFGGQTAVATEATWTTSDPTIASLRSTDAGVAVIHGEKAGAATITATLGDLTATATVTVNAPHVVSIDLTPASPSLAAGTAVDLVATATYSDTTTADVTAMATWTSSASATATVDGGHVAGLVAGTAEISAALDGVTGTTTVTVTAATLVSIAVTPTNPSVAKGLTRQFTATATFSDDSTQDLTTQATWTTGAAATATITSTGLATAVAVGTTPVTASFGGMSGSTDLTVTAATLESIAVTPAGSSIAKGLSQQFTATGTLSDTTHVDLTTQATWTTGDSAKATVSTSGMVAGVGVGTTSVTATVNGISGATDVTVTSATLESISVTPTTPSVAKGLTQQFTATGTYSDASFVNITDQVTWSASDISVVTISNAAGSRGLATASGTGTSIIGATLAGVSGTTTLTVSAATITGISVTPTAPSIAKGLTQQFTAVATLTDGSHVDVTTQAMWQSSDLAVATVSSAAGSEGLATGVGVGTSSISATLGGQTGATDLAVSAATLASIAVTPTNPSLAKGLTQQFTAIGTFTDTHTQDLTTQVTWASSLPIATISNAAGTEGLAKGTAVGDTTISATLNGKTGTTTLTVSAATLTSIAVTPTTPTLAKGLTLQFTATGTFTDNSNRDITDQVTWGSSSGAASISNAAGSGGLATGTAVGDTIISAALDGKTGTTTLSVTAATVTSIAVTPTTPSLAKGLTLQFTATGTFTDNSTADITTQVTWGSSTGAAAISGAAGSEGLATGSAVGDTVISASLGGVTGTTTLHVTAASITSIAVTPTTPSLAKGLTQQFTATATLTDQSTVNVTTQVTWASSTGAAAISNAAGSEGLATGTAVGTTTISATLSGKTGSTTLSVTAATIVSIAVTPATPAVAKGLTLQFTATATLTDTTSIDVTTQVTWSSSDDAIATVSNAADSEGLATAVAPGTTTIHAALSGKTGSTDLTVKQAALTSIAVTPTNPTVAVGLTRQFTAIGTFTDHTSADITAQVTWASSDTAVAQISNASGSEGLANALTTGPSTISASLNGVTGTTALTVSGATLLSIAVTPTDDTVASGFSVQFTAIGTFSDTSHADLTTQVTWGSSDGEIAAISNAVGSEGLADTAATGTATITAKLDGITGSTTLTVTPAVLTSIAITPTNPSVTLGIDQQLGATGTFSDGSTQDLTTQVTWGSSDEAVAIIGNSSEIYGVVTGVSVGTATITATLDGVTGSTTATVTAATLTSIDITPTNPGLAVGLTQAFTATGTFSDQSTRDLTTQVTWDSSDTETATISNAPGEEGVASGGAPGQTLISASLNGVTGTTTLTVTDAELVSIEVTPTEQSLAKGLTLQFTATGTFTDQSQRDLTTQVTWDTDDHAVAVIENAAGSNGLATGKGVGVTQVSATLGGVTGSTALAVTAANLTSIEVTPANTTATAGLLRVFTATGTFSDQTVQDITTQVTWTSSDETVAVISNASLTEGLASALAPGTTTISATLSGKTGSTTLDVVPAALASIKVTPADPTVAIGGTQQFVATGTFTDNHTQDLTTQVTWASDNTAFATVSNATGTNGLATGTGTGTATISATLSGKTGSTTLTVSGPQLLSITVTATNPTLMQQQRLQLKAIANYSDLTTVNVTSTAVWASDNTASATVGTGGTNPGRVDTLQAAGVANISATFGGVAGTTVVTVSAVQCHIVINEVQAGGTGMTNPSADEWVEIYNPCTGTIDATSYTLVYRAATTTGSTDTATLGAVGVMMAPGDLRMHAHVAASTAGANVTFGTGTSGQLAGANGAVGLRSGPLNTGTLVDAVAYGAVNANHPFAEGGTSSTAPALVNGKSVSRSPNFP
ncbi:MAG: Ig-like domain-containing protein [Deltaproteobacteria bacterium]|nr:Ig-like domain-containing protein [Deltaproteobacteria bacterium]